MSDHDEGYIMDENEDTHFLMEIPASSVVRGEVENTDVSDDIYCRDIILDILREAMVYRDDIADIWVSGHEGDDDWTDMEPEPHLVYVCMKDGTDITMWVYHCGNGPKRKYKEAP